MYAIASRTSRTKRYPDGVRHYGLEELRPAANTNVVITDVIDRIILVSTSTVAATITTLSAHEGQIVSIFMITRSSTGGYTMAGVIGSAGSGALTFDAVNENARIERVDGSWRVVGLIGATVV
jgi:hypothetical protein